MNAAKYADVNRKLPGGTAVEFNGQTVYVEHDRGDGWINLRPTKEKCHTEDNTFLILKSEISLATKYKSKLTVVAKKETPEEKNDKKDLNSFFDGLGTKIPFNCQNCRRPLYALNKPAMRSVCAHILAKSKYPSIAKNPDNILFLGCLVFGSCCNCHSEFDSSVEKRVKMPVYDIAIKRFELLKPYLTEKELIMAEEDLGVREKCLNLSKSISERRHTS